MNAKTLIKGMLIGFWICANLSALSQGSFQSIPVQNSSYLSSTTEMVFYAQPDYVTLNISDGTLGISFGANDNYLPPMAGEGNSLYYADEYLPGHDLYMYFSQPLQIFGMWIEPYEQASPITETFYNGATLLGTISETAAKTGNGSFFAAQTVGTGFTSVEIYDPSSPAGYAISDLGYAVVPEPTMPWLSGSGLVLVLALRKRLCAG